MIQFMKKMVAPTIVGTWMQSSEYHLKNRLKRLGAQIPAKRMRKSWVNSTLQTHKQVDEALETVKECGLIPHSDPPKNWDGISMLDEILLRTDKHAHILEVGATLYSTLLVWLYQYGYRNLTGIDLIFDKPLHRGPIQYEPGDLTHSRFQDESFDGIVSMSVIEHGVNINAYFKEMFRLLKPDGILITSTDYWKNLVDTRNQKAFGVPIKIFNEGDIRNMLDCAYSYGFKTCGEVNLECDEEVVHWKQFDLRYTFLCFALQKPS